MGNPTVKVLGMLIRKLPDFVLKGRSSVSQIYPI